GLKHLLTEDLRFAAIGFLYEIRKSKCLKFPESNENYQLNTDTDINNFYTNHFSKIKEKIEGKGFVTFSLRSIKDSIIEDSSIKGYKNDEESKENKYKNYISNVIDVIECRTKEKDDVKSKEKKEER